ncbi:MAG: hypothetical protein ACLUEQ_04830 [Cloacibacillus evryensis]
MVSYPGLVHIGKDKDFAPVIAKAIELGGWSEDKSFTGINGGHTVTGLATARCSPPRIRSWRR